MVLWFPQWSVTRSFLLARRILLGLGLNLQAIHPSSLSHSRFSSVRPKGKLNTVWSTATHPGRRHNLVTLGEKGKRRNKSCAIKAEGATERSACLSLGKDGSGKWRNSNAKSESSLVSRTQQTCQQLWADLCFLNVWWALHYQSGELLQKE